MPCLMSHVSSQAVVRLLPVQAQRETSEDSPLASIHLIHPLSMKPMCQKKLVIQIFFTRHFVRNMLKHLEPAASNAKCCAKLVNSVKVHQLCMESR